MSETIERILEFIKKKRSVSLSFLESNLDINVDTLEKLLDEMIEKEKIKFSTMYICPKCGLRIGLEEDLHDIEDIDCPFCEYEFTIDDDKIEVFFFTP